MKNLLSAFALFLCLLPDAQAQPSRNGPPSPAAQMQDANSAAFGARQSQANQPSTAARIQQGGQGHTSDDTLPETARQNKDKARRHHPRHKEKKAQPVE